MTCNFPLLNSDKTDLLNLIKRYTVSITLTCMMIPRIPVRNLGITVSLINSGEQCFNWCACVTHNKQCFGWTIMLRDVSDDLHE